MIFKQLGARYPIFQAGMAGGLTTPELVAAVSNFGAIGSIGAGYMTAEELKKAVKNTKTLTDKSFGVNLFIPEEVTFPKVEEIQQMISFLNQYSHESPIPSNWTFTDKGKVTFEEQL
ncbi:Nitronate monooxygenase [Bacillus sp. UNCCL13]|nr:Nitronate monooxygenase [Bacillus sp. UNCCL13]